MKKFIATRELGKLAKWLRILGYDCVYAGRQKPPEVVIKALREDRIILARSAVYGKYTGVRHVMVACDFVEEQIEEVFRAQNLEVKEDGIFTVCVECNAPLEDIEREEVKGRISEYVYDTQKKFKRCVKCDKIFWKGTHWDMVKEWLEKRK